MDTIIPKIWMFYSTTVDTSLYRNYSHNKMIFPGNYIYVRQFHLYLTFFFSKTHIIQIIPPRCAPTCQVQYLRYLTESNCKKELSATRNLRYAGLVLAEYELEWYRHTDSPCNGKIQLQCTTTTNRLSSEQSLGPTVESKFPTGFQ